MASGHPSPKGTRPFACVLGKKQEAQGPILEAKVCTKCPGVLIPANLLEEAQQSKCALARKGGGGEAGTLIRFTGIQEEVGRDSVWSSRREKVKP